MTLNNPTTDAPFRADPEKCIACGQCVRDCPAAVITLDSGLASATDQAMEDCIFCQHCLAVCPTAAASVGRWSPEDSLPMGQPSPKALDLLMRSRRSVRQFTHQPVERALFDKVLATTAHAPTGTNTRARRFIAVLDSAVLAELRDRCCRALVAGADRMPERMGWLASAASKWLDKGRDVIFRDAPHLLVVTSGPEASTPEADCLIALSYFELAAQTNGIGTVWCGMIEMMLRYLPETRAFLGIPDDDVLGYAMLFGYPAVQYQRTTQHAPENVAVLDRLP